ncbi:MAG: YceI family protein [Bacteroidetes bacterium]|nr:YceI family protein [Bacteroidota bacterium]
MKKLLSIGIALMGAMFILAFNPTKEDVYTVDAANSLIGWSAKKVGGGHTGTVKITEGSLVYNGKTLQRGVFLMDMASITSDNARVTTHLKSPDFFSSEKNPSSKFEITKVSAVGKERVNITGNLTIKGITHPLSFPATVKHGKDVIVAVASGIRVDRTKYDIKFRSKTFFGDIGDKAIDDEFELNINLTAKKS